ncbi:DUF3320 domain-containing protein [Streptomyces sp. RKAG293]|uniref:DUF3320 domain-containing protein n=1 Tax=Streptomyces sp. RKAG293 TaxID=2893403 RepID=UPI002033E17D|nr:DUF3320 domain-containing protein [Streptomyces sp. RKAG293]MCM2418120.1 DUF3320 domain-containing protein [Streptomyces sp. RKAG293]
MTIPNGFGDNADRERLRAILAGWRTSLVDLSGRNRLLNFRHTKSATLEISLPSAQKLVEGLDRGWSFAPLPDDEPETDGAVAATVAIPAAKGEHGDWIVTQKTTAPALLRALNSLRSKSTQLFNDYGLWTLNLGVGMLRWREDGAETSSDAPLILLPVLIERTKDGRIRLRANDDEDPRLNPALKVKLEQFHIDWASVVEQDPTDLRAVLSTAARAVAGKTGWQVSDRVVVALFASHKESMYQDLLDNESRVLDSDLVRAMALGAGAGLADDRFYFEAIDLDRIDELSPPEDCPLVLDADASQRQAVAAAVAGQSFVLDGPPGTGKSQTITNMIAGLMHAGRSVLFVSEKAAALDVVLNRLRSVGLDSYALALHSHSTSRKAVAHELGRALAEEPRAPQLSQQTLAQARETRMALSAYAEAMNEVREPLGQTLHDVIGQVGQLSEAPVAYLTASDDTAPQEPAAFRAEHLSGSDLRRIIEATKGISDAWEAVADPSFPWRDLRAGLPHPKPVLEQAKAARDGLAVAVDRYPDLAADGEPITDQPGIDRLLALLALLDSRSPVPEPWLTTSSFADTVEDRVDVFLTELRRLQRATAAARAAVGERWQEVPTRLMAEPGAAEQVLLALSPPGLEPIGFTEVRARELADELDATADVLERTHQSLTNAGRTAGLNAPESLEEARHVCDVIGLAGTTHRPPDQWLAPQGAERAEQAAVCVIADALSAFFTRRDQVRSAQSLAASQAGPGWADLRAELNAGRPANDLALDELEPVGVDIAALSRRRAAELAECFETLADTLEAAGRHADSAAARLGYGSPKSTMEAEDVATLIESATASDRALKDWLDPRVRPLARAAVADITLAAAQLTAAEAAARDMFLPEVVSAPGLPEAIGRLAESRRGIGGMLSSGVRADRKLVAQLTHAGSWRGDVHDQLPLALAWRTAYQDLRTLTASDAELLGRYGRTELPDIPALGKALEHAESVHSLAPHTVADPYRRGLLAAQLADGGEPHRELLEQGAALRDGLAVWHLHLGRPYLSPYAAELTKRPLADVARWLRAHLAPLSQAIALLDTVTSVGHPDDSRGSDHTLASARTAITIAHAAQRESAAFGARATTDRALLGPWYRGQDTEATDLSETAPHGVTGYEATGNLLRRALDATRRQTGPHASDLERDLLGRYAAGGRPATDAVRSALEAAHLVARLAPDTIADPARRAQLADVLADGRPEPHGLLRQTEKIRVELDRWHAYARQPHLAVVGSALVAHPLDKAADWLRAHVEPFHDAADLVRSVARVMNDSAGLTLSRARETVTAVVSARAAEARFAENDSAYRELLGVLYQGPTTNRDEVLDGVDWAQKVRRTAHAGHSAPLSEAAARTLLTTPPNLSVSTRDEDWRRQRNALAGHFEPVRAEELRRELGQSLPAAESVLARLDRDPFGPDAWTKCAGALTLLRGYHLEGLPGQLAQREVSADDFPAAMERSVLTAWVEHQLTVDARLKPMQAAERDELVQRFRSADRDLVAAAHADVIAACNARRPRRTTVGQAAVIRREAEKQRRHMPVRHLLGQTGDVVRVIKPCFMMSPLTVSQFLPPDFKFDVVIFDEASQVLPQDAVNSVYRGKSLIVAGDQKQLPPTSFFNAGGAGDEDDEWDGNDAAFESILDMCKASGVLTGLPLRWHYRSRHENLIAFSNHEFYEPRMITFPGALEHGPDIGVEFFKADGVYDRGGQSNNPGEAAKVAQRVIHHFDTRPGLTLGVVALSKAQAEAIEEAVQKVRAARPDLDHFFTEGRLDGFFVKNLETVQGDERDVIILSIGYGRDQNGKLLSIFGPINKEGGWRRLNVAVTRSRRRMEVVASFHGGELPDSTNKSVQHLKRYLQYAQHGPAILQTEAAADPEAAPESPFEEEVLDVLRGWGYSVQPQVGVAGFRIDMAVRHPAATGTYALGIECDGAMYHSSRAARDRDRLREAVLTDLGWKLHRIWGTDWYRNRRDAVARLQAAVEAACEVDPHARQDPIPSREGGRDPVVDTDKGIMGVSAQAATTGQTAGASDPKVRFVSVDDGPVAWSRPYQEVDVKLLVAVRNGSARQEGRPGIELQDPDAAGVVAEVALFVIEVEGPVEQEVIFKRVREAWGLGRSGQVVRDRIGRALQRLVRQGKVVRQGTAYDRPGRDVEFARTPTPQCERKVVEVPASERQFVLRNVVEEGPGVHREDLLREAARFFGWARLGSDIRDALTEDIEELTSGGYLVMTESGLMPVQGA